MGLSLRMTKRKPLTVKLVYQCLIFRAEQRGFKFTCGICGGYISVDDVIQFDHVHELSDTGQDVYDNLRPVHDQCHIQKSGQSVTFRAHIKRLSEGGRKRKSPPMKSRGFQKVKSSFRKPLPNV